jgi:hypothetical protein
MSANDTQVGGSHYNQHGALQHWDVVAHFKLDYFQGQITKYVMRWRDKGGVDDLKKARHFLDKYIELEEAKLPKVTETPGSLTVHAKPSDIFGNVFGNAP